jgi:uncharacterized protein (UPF0332 family)
VNELERARLQQAREAMIEARALRDAGMDASLVLSMVYQAFHEPVSALVHEGRVPDTMQSVTIGLFEQRFVKTGIISPRLGESVRRAFALKPKCSGGTTLVAPGEIDRLLAAAEELIGEAERVLAA